MKPPASDAILSQRSITPDPPIQAPKASQRPPASVDSVNGSPDARRPAKKASKQAKNEAENLDGLAGSAIAATDDAKKRVRLKPETREQLLERLRNPPLSLHETSILLRVSRATVRRYADAGRLPCLRTPGGQRRFTLRDIEAFYRQLKSKR